MTRAQYYFAGLAVVLGFAAGALMQATGFLDPARPLTDRLGQIDWSTISAVLVAAGTGALAWQTWRLARSADQERADRGRADVVTYAEVVGYNITIVVENRGLAAARDVVVEPVDDRPWLTEGNLARLPWTISFMSAGAKVPRTFERWTMDPEIVKRLAGGRVSTRWTDDNGSQRVRESIVDPTPWLAMRPAEGSLSDIAEAIKRLENAWNAVARRIR